MRLCLILALAAALMGCGPPSPPAPQAQRAPLQRIDPRIEAQFGGQVGTAILTMPQTVEVFRLDNPPMQSATSSADIPPDFPRFSDFTRLAGPVTPDKSTLAAITNALTDAGRYRFGLVDACIFHADLGLVFRKAGHELVIVSCLHCGDMKVYLDGHNARVAGHEIFVYRTAALLAIAQQLFPQDNRLRELSPSDW